MDLKELDGKLFSTKNGATILSEGEHSILRSLDGDEYEFCMYHVDDVYELIKEFNDNHPDEKILKSELNDIFKGKGNEIIIEIPDSYGTTDYGECEDYISCVYPDMDCSDCPEPEECIY